MTILVTGANGQLGNEMRILASSSPDSFIFTDVSQQEGQQTTYLDITNLEAIRQLVRDSHVDAIVNCAAWTNVDGAEDPEKYDLVERLNALAPENLAIAMKEVGGLLIHISTDYVFGREPYNTPCKEDQCGTPTGVYGATKLLGEQKIQGVFENSAEGKGGGYVILRTAWLYSEFGKNFCKTMLNLTATKPQLKVVFDQCGTPTYALDLAKAILTILKDYRQECCGGTEASYAKAGIYHFSNEGVCSWYDFTQMIQRIALELGHYDSLSPKGEAACLILPCHSSEFPSPVTRPSYSVLDKTKVKQTFAIQIPYWTDSLRDCITNIINPK